MNILITGANGQLGNEMRLLAASDNENHYFFTDVVEQSGVETLLLDITDEQALQQFITAHHINAIVNCAAYTNVDAAEDNRELAFRLNALAPELLANIMAQQGGLLLHISTDYVYGKELYNTPCTELMQGEPTGVYGESKLEGEKRIIASGADYIIIRTAWLYSEYGRNFLRTMLQLTMTKPSLKVVFDQVGTPTYALDLAKVIMLFMQREDIRQLVGIYHYSNEGVCSWYDFAKQIAAFAHHDACDIQPCHSSEFPSKVLRPAYSVLDKTKIKQTLGITIPHWTDSLRQCMQRL